jgi:methylated-DNA-[protein]-cysteine S-methyltransferase
MHEVTLARTRLVEVPTPVGALWVATDAQGAVVAAGWPDERSPLDWATGLGVSVEGVSDEPSAAAERLRAWFADPSVPLDDLVVRPAGTEFQQRVWEALRQIPLGRTWSYGQLARAVGRPRGAQAVGAANGANPVAVLVPCHRVVGSDGRLTGYAGGLHRKEWLLAHEGALTSQPRLF